VLAYTAIHRYILEIGLDARFSAPQAEISRALPGVAV
jgi:hypothetical protein